MKEVKFEIDELECTSCANTVLTVLKKKGIDNVDVDVVDKTANISFDENKFTVDEIKKIIKSAGFNAELVD